MLCTGEDEKVDARLELETVLVRSSYRVEEVVPWGSCVMIIFRASVFTTAGAGRLVGETGVPEGEKRLVMYGRGLV